MQKLKLLPDLFLRAPQYTFQGYHPDRLPEVIAMASFRMALRLASPEFYAVLAAKDFVFERLNDREYHSLCKYYNRMCFRPTPFGSFASFTLLRWAENTAVRLAAEEQLILHVLPDQADRQPAQPFSKDTLIIRNPTLYRVEGAWRYYRFLADEQGKYRFSLQEIDAVRFNNALLRLLDTGPVTADKLVDWVGIHAGASEEDAADYLDYLLADNVLYAPEQGAMIVREAPVPALMPGKKYYAALERPLIDGGLGEADQRELTAALEFLAQLAPAADSAELKLFAAAFSLRYDGQKVPLLEALDPDRGLPFGSDKAAEPGAALLDELPFANVKAAASLPGNWAGWQQLLLGKWSGQHPIVLTDADLTKLGPRPEPVLPNTLAVMFRKAAGHLVLEQAGGASATQLIGRFSAFSSEVTRLCQKLSGLEAAANPGVVFADIGQLSDDHVDNINRRDRIYPYEIPVNVYSALPEANQLPPGDLLLSARNGELILESKRLGKRVIPRLATAYNYHHTGLSIFRLLCALSYQRLSGPLGLDPGRLLPGLRYYPRILYGRTVLSPARWHLKRTEFDEENWVERHGLPRYVSMGETDQQLVADLSDPDELRFLLKCTAGMEIVQLQEYLLPDRSVKTGTVPLAGQFIAFLTHDQAIYSPVEQSARTRLRVTRSYPPGTDWLYLKIYCTAPAADRLLQGVIEPLLRRQARQVRCWFFIRYTDPDHHLRLRIRVWSAAADTGRLLVAFRAQLRRSGMESLVPDLLADTYRRELERYGPDLIEQAEAVFHAGSELVLTITGTTEMERFRLGFAIARLMIASFFPEPLRQAAFITGMAAVYLQEFGAGDKKLKVGLDRKYRSLKTKLHTDLEANELIGALKKISVMAASKSEEVRRGLLADLVHMQLNRTFTHSQRQQELLVYHCLQKHLLRPDPAC
jgi:thiopeptide-type bacteriocin biosynthesis protein